MMKVEWDTQDLDDKYFVGQSFKPHLVDSECVKSSATGDICQIGHQTREPPMAHMHGLSLTHACLRKKQERLFPPLANRWRWVYPCHLSASFYTVQELTSICRL